MTWFAVYRISDSKLQSIGTEVADPLPDGLAVKDMGKVRPKGNWNESTLSFDPKPIRRVYSISEFANRFTRQERINFRTSSNPNVQDLFFLMFLSEEIDVHDPDISQGLDSLETFNVIINGRAAEIRGS